MTYFARSQILTGYASMARSLGLSPERLVKAVGLNLAALEDLDARISATAFADLLERSAKAAKVEDFGLRLAESRGVGILGPVGIVMHAQVDLRSALHSLAHYLPVHNEALVLRLDEERDLSILNLKVQLSGLTEARQVTELSLGAFFRILCRLSAPRWKPQCICFEHAAPKNPTMHKRFFGCRVEFEHEFNGIVFPTGDLDTPIAMSDKMLAQYAHRYIDTVMLHRNASANEKIRELIRILLPSGSCNAQKVARSLGVDRRTMHRYLSQTGASFSSAVTDVRREMAMKLLASRRPLIDIADLLGFSGAAAFSRWFKQKFDCNPSAWRNAPERHDQ